MTKDDILSMAKKAGFPFNKFGCLACDDENEIDADAMFERFAALVAEKATEQANARQNASWALMCKKMVQAEIDAHKILYGAASDVLSCIESQYRPPVRDVPECGKMVQVRLHELAMLSEVATKSHQHIATHLVLSEMKEALD
jgi:hypothetical protein